MNQTEYRVHGVRVERFMPLTPVQGPRPIVFVHGGCHGSWSWVKVLSRRLRKGAPWLAGRPPEGLAAANEAITAADQLHFRINEAELHRLKGEGRPLIIRSAAE